jgi:hypothetical protein
LTLELERSAGFGDRLAGPARIGEAVRPQHHDLLALAGLCPALQNL